MDFIEDWDNIPLEDLIDFEGRIQYQSPSVINNQSQEFIHPVDNYAAETVIALSNMFPTTTISEIEATFTAGASAVKPQTQHVEDAGLSESEVPHPHMEMEMDDGNFLDSWPEDTGLFYPTYDPSAPASSCREPEDIQPIFDQSQEATDSQPLEDCFASKSYAILHFGVAHNFDGSESIPQTNVVTALPQTSTDVVEQSLALADIQFQPELASDSAATVEPKNNNINIYKIYVLNTLATNSDIEKFIGNDNIYQNNGDMTMGLPLPVLGADETLDTLEPQNEQNVDVGSAIDLQQQYSDIMLPLASGLPPSKPSKKKKSSKARIKNKGPGDGSPNTSVLCLLSKKKVPMYELFESTTNEEERKRFSKAAYCRESRERKKEFLRRCTLMFIQVEEFCKEYVQRFGYDALPPEVIRALKDKQTQIQ